MPEIIPETNHSLPVFIDSSIQIAKTVREPPMKRRIAEWLLRHGPAITGLAALQEFKRRVLRDVAYLLSKLAKTESYQATLDHVTSVLTPHQVRKQRICIPLLHQILIGRSDEELTERARLYLRALLVTGEEQFKREWRLIDGGLDCYWAKFPIRERKRYLNYDFGDTCCSKSHGRCEIGADLHDRLETCKKLFEYLRGLPPERLSPELESARNILGRIVGAKNPEDIQNEDLCLTAGDMLLAIDSEHTREFFTMNYRESQAYCDFFDQNLTIRPNNPAHDERSYLTSEKPWPSS